MNAVLIQGPVVEPISRKDLRAHLHLDGSHDALLGSLIAAARMTIEAQSGLRLLEQQWRVHLYEWPEKSKRLPVSPVMEVKSVKWVGGQTYVLPDDAYQTQPVGLEAYVRLLQPRPSSWRDKGHHIEIDMVAGFGRSPAQVPKDLCLAVKSLAAHWYDIDDWHQPPSSRAMPAHVLAIVDQHRSLRV